VVIAVAESVETRFSSLRSRDAAMGLVGLVEVWAFGFRGESVIAKTAVTITRAAMPA
jgi:hypothetical protein